MAAVAACGRGGGGRMDAGAGPSATAGSSSGVKASASVKLNSGARVDPPPRAGLNTREEIGRLAFFDANLSTPPGTSCASCHDPKRAFSGNHGSTNGVALGSRPGHFARRNTPSVLYLRYVPTFRFALEDDDDLAESPFGGLSWSGRADTVGEFSRLPLLDADEMNNGSEAEIGRKVRAAPYASALAGEFPGALDTPPGAVRALGDALQAYLTSDAMAPFTSKFDDYLRGTATLTEIEKRGLAAFKNPEKGACDACHRFVETSKRTERSLFTDFGYDAVAVPRNHDLPVNRDPGYSDVGLCERKQARVPSSAAQWCGDFRTPSLRNVAVRERFMHNGRFTKLRDVVAFYATRATAPYDWYPRGAKFDDVPARYRGNVNVTSLPYNRAEGDKAPLDDDDIDAIVAFLETLTDAQYREPVAAR